METPLRTLQPPRRCGVVLVDDKPIARLGLSATLAAEADLEVVGEAADARHAFRVIDALRPALVITDLWLPGMDGISVVRDIRSRSSATKVIIFTAGAGRRDVVDALEGGAAAYVLKTEPLPRVVEAIRAVLRGERYLSPAAAALLDDTQAGSGADGEAFATLSVREREVFALVVRGFSNREIGAELCIAPSTVDSHRRQLNEKLGCCGTSSLFRYAVEHDLLREAVIERLGRPSRGRGAV